MKAKFLQWALLMAVASSFSLTSCGSDDDSDNNGGSTSGGSSTHKGHEYVISLLVKRIIDHEKRLYLHGKPMIYNFLRLWRSIILLKKRKKRPLIVV